MYYIQLMSNKGIRDIVRRSLLIFSKSRGGVKEIIMGTLGGLCFSLLLYPQAQFSQFVFIPTVTPQVKMEIPKVNHFIRITTSCFHPNKTETHFFSLPLCSISCKQWSQCVRYLT